MKISMTQAGEVSFTGMDPALATALVDLVQDLSSGDAVLLYGPGYESPVVRPTEDLRDEFERLLHADARFPGSFSEDLKDGEMWRTATLVEEDHKRVWELIETTKEHA